MRYTEILTEAQSKKLKHGSNRGAVNEFFIGCAVVAKFQAGNKAVKPADIIRIAKEVSSTPNLSKEFQYELNGAKDTLKFENIISNEKNINDIKDIDTTIASMDSEIKGDAKFVNSDHYISKWARLFEKNGKPDEIHVKAAGEEDQSGTKVDIFVTYIKPGEEPRPIRHISLKTGSNLVGQASPRKYESLKTFFDALGIDLPNNMPNYDNDVKGSVEIVMNKAASQLGNLTAGEKSPKEKIVLDNLVNFINHHAALDDEKLIIVNVEKGNYSAQKISRLYDNLNQVDLETTYAKTGARPDIRVHEKGKRNNFLLKIRYTYSPERINSKNQKVAERHKLVVEVGKLFKTLAALKPRNLNTEPDSDKDGIPNRVDAKPNDPNTTV